jgi:hypothetical protein
MTFVTQQRFVPLIQEIIKVERAKQLKVEHGHKATSGKEVLRRQLALPLFNRKFVLKTSIG